MKIDRRVKIKVEREFPINLIERLYGDNEELKRSVNVYDLITELHKLGHEETVVLLKRYKTTRSINEIAKHLKTDPPAITSIEGVALRKLREALASRHGK